MDHTTLHNSAGLLLRAAQPERYPWDDASYMQALNARLPKQPARHVQTMVAGVAFRVFDWSDQYFSVRETHSGASELKSECPIYGANPGYDGSPYGQQAEKWRAVSFIANGPTYVAIYPANENKYGASRELMVHYQSAEGASRACEFRLVWNRAFNGWEEKDFRQA